eukprot:g78958.t1
MFSVVFSQPQCFLPAFLGWPEWRQNFEFVIVTPSTNFCGRIQLFETKHQAIMLLSFIPVGLVSAGSSWPNWAALTAAPKEGLKYRELCGVWDNADGGCVESNCYDHGERYATLSYSFGYPESATVDKSDNGPYSGYTVHTDFIYTSIQREFNNKYCGKSASVTTQAPDDRSQHGGKNSDKNSDHRTETEHRTTYEVLNITTAGYYQLGEVSAMDSSYTKIMYMPQYISVYFSHHYTKYTEFPYTSFPDGTCYNALSYLNLMCPCDGTWHSNSTRSINLAKCSEGSCPAFVKDGKMITTYAWVKVQGDSSVGAAQLLLTTQSEDEETVQAATPQPARSMYQTDNTDCSAEEHMPEGYAIVTKAPNNNNKPNNKLNLKSAKRTYGDDGMNNNNNGQNNGQNGQNNNNNNGQNNNGQNGQNNNNNNGQNNNGQNGQNNNGQNGQNNGQNGQNNGQNGQNNNGQNGQNNNGQNNNNNDGSGVDAATESSVSEEASGVNAIVVYTAVGIASMALSIGAGWYFCIRTKPELQSATDYTAINDGHNTLHP